ncbi:MAG: HlyD family efflux transporter periplasmic adaptor subunit [Dehalococcoidia bacterium]
MESSPPISPRSRLQLQRTKGALQFSPLELISLGLAFLLASIAGYMLYARTTGLNDTPAATAQSAYIPAFERTLSTTISASGTVQSTQSVALTFGSAGKIAGVNVKVGDKVVAGQELATLDSTQLQSALRSAQTSLASAQAKLSDVVNPSAADRAAAEQTVLNAQNQINTAQKALHDLKLKPLASDIATAQQGVNTATNSLQSAQDAITKAQKDLTDAQNAAATAQNDMSAAYSKLADAQRDVAKAEDACADAPNAPSLPGVGNRAADAPFVSSTIKCNGNADALKAYNAAIATYTSSANAYNSSITANQTKQDALVTARNAISNGNLSRSLDNATIGLQTATQKLADAQKPATALEISAAETTLKGAQSSLLTAQEKLKDTLTPGQDVILPLQSAVDQAAGSVATAQDNLKLATIVAPFDGTVSVVNGTVGGQATATGSVITLLNPNLIRIDANVDQTDVASLKVGQSAIATFDALTGNIYRATVATVGLTPTTASGVVTYVVSFAVDTAALPASTPVPAPGMTASLTVTTASAPNALVVPSRAIRGTGANATVTVKTADGKEEQRRVVTGITNGTLTQITSGLTRGDQVLYTITPTSTTTTTTGTQQRTTGSQQFGGGTFPGGGGVQVPVTR